MERAYLNGKLVKEKNNFIMIRPEGRITIGADASGSNNFKGYINSLAILPIAMDEKTVGEIYHKSNHFDTPSLGDDDFEEIDPDSKFVLSPDMKPVREKREEFTLSAQTANFNEDPIGNGGITYGVPEGDFVVMATVSDMEGLATHNVKGYNEGGILIADGFGNYYQLGAFPLYNCGNMFTMLSDRGRPQFPNYKGYDFDPYLQFERRGNQLFARTSKDGKKWTNMPGSPVEVKTSTLRVGAYQTTYTENLSWVKLKDFVIYQKQ